MDEEVDYQNPVDFLTNCGLPARQLAVPGDPEHQQSRDDGDLKQEVSQQSDVDCCPGKLVLFSSRKR